MSDLIYMLEFVISLTGQSYTGSSQCKTRLSSTFPYPKRLVLPLYRVLQVRWRSRLNSRSDTTKAGPATMRLTGLIAILLIYTGIYVTSKCQSVLQ